MRVAAIVGVKNEETLIRACLDHLRTIGVDRTVVQDYGSTDATLASIEQGYGDWLSVECLDEEENPDPETWGEREAVLAQSTGADWVLFLDADEFWLPENDDIQRWLAGCAENAVTVDRYNVVMKQGQSWSEADFHPDRLRAQFVHTGQRVGLRERLRTDPNARWIGATPMPKVAIRPQLVSRILPGHHGALDIRGGRMPSTRHAGCVIAHLPFTTWPRFKAKIDAIRASLELQACYHKGDTAWHWRRWVDADEAGELGREFEAQFIGESELEAGLRQRTIRGIPELLSKNPEAPPSPESGPTAGHR